MDIHQPLPLLGGLSPHRFMQRHWQRKPLLIRQAIPGFGPPIARTALFALAARDDVESRLVVGPAVGGPPGAGWRLRHGPLARRSLPPIGQPNWTLLVQGVDLHHPALHALLNRCRFVPDARLDDVMVSYAAPGGGVGPHFDSYDVFLLQALGRRRWRIGRQQDLSLQPGLPLKILRNFVPQQEFDLEPGDMLYLPPRYAHDGVALQEECMTCSIGFRAPGAGELAAELLQRLAQDAADELPVRHYRDAGQAALGRPAELPAAMVEFAQRALNQALADPMRLARCLGEHLTEPKPLVWFEASAHASPVGAVQLDRRTRMLYDAHHVFINGESYRASGRDASLMRQLADARSLDAPACRGASAAARDLLHSWLAAGWLHGV